MFEGKERRRELIAELRTTHALQSPERREKTLESEALSSKQASAQREEHKVRGCIASRPQKIFHLLCIFPQDHVVEEGVVGGAAGLLGRQLDTLTKELKRLQCERRVHAMVMLAEHQRRQREAEESGRRQREERLRRTEDEIFKQVGARFRISTLRPWPPLCTSIRSLPDGACAPRHSGRLLGGHHLTVSGAHC